VYVITDKGLEMLRMDLERMIHMVDTTKQRLKL
jgi:hypothetical protein